MRSKKIVILLTFILSACNTILPSPTATPSPTKTLLPTQTPSPIPTETPTPTETPIPTQTPLPSIELIVESERLPEALILVKEDFPFITSVIKGMYERKEINNFPEASESIPLDYFVVPKDPRAIPILYIDQNKDYPEEKYENRETRPFKPVAMFRDGTGGAYIANLWLNADKTVGVYYYHIVPSFSHAETIEEILHKVVTGESIFRGIKYPGIRVAWPSYNESPELCAEETKDTDYCEYYLSQSEVRIKGFEEWAEHGTVPKVFENGLDIFPANFHCDRCT